MKFYRINNCLIINNFYHVIWLIAIYKYLYIFDVFIVLGNFIIFKLEDVNLPITWRSFFSFLALIF